MNGTGSAGVRDDFMTKLVFTCRSSARAFKETSCRQWRGVSHSWMLTTITKLCRYLIPPLILHNQSGPFCTQIHLSIHSEIMKRWCNLFFFFDIMYALILIPPSLRGSKCERGRDRDTLMGFIKVNLNTLRVWVWTSKPTLPSIANYSGHSSNSQTGESGEKKTKKPKLAEVNGRSARVSRQKKKKKTLGWRACHRVNVIVPAPDAFWRGSRKASSSPLFVWNRVERRNEQPLPPPSSVDHGGWLQGPRRHTLWHAIDSRGDERKCCVIWFHVQGS